MKVIIVGGVAGGASCAARLAQAGRESRDHHGGARAVRVVRELRAAVSRRWRDREGVEPARGDRSHFPLAVRDRLPHGLRGDQYLPGKEDGRPAQRRDRRGHDRVLRQARALAGRAVDPSASARHRSAGDLPGEDGARRTGDPRVDRQGLHVPLRDGALLRLPDGAAQDACGRHRGRVHRARDGGEPRAPRTSTSPSSRWVDQILAPLDQEMAQIVEGYVERHGIRLALERRRGGIQARRRRNRSRCRRSRARRIRPTS